MWLCAATLMLRLLVPGGYMIGSDHGRVAMLLCPGVAMPMTGGSSANAAMPGGPQHTMVSRTGGTEHHDHRPSRHQGVDQPCAFAGLSAAMLGPIDPVLLLGLIGFILRRGVLPSGQVVPRDVRHVRPFLRGPPVPA